MMNERIIERSTDINLDGLSPEKSIEILKKFVGLNAILNSEYVDSTDISVKWQSEETNKEYNERIRKEYECRVEAEQITKSLRRLIYEKLKLEFGN